jgi:hypothetical protein
MSKNQEIPLLTKQAKNISPAAGYPLKTNYTG